jgi:hypothetical protein
MRSFIVGCAAAIGIAIVAGFILEGYQRSSESAYATIGARV